MEYGILSIIPPLVAILLALTTKQVFISLILGIFSGAMILTDWTFFAAVNMTLEEIVAIFAEAWITKTIIFSFLRKTVCVTG